MTRGILYYSDNQINMKMALACRKTLLDSGLPITSVTLKPTPFGKNIHLKAERGYVTMFRQILTGLENMTEDIVYFAEADVLYHPEHFNFIPPRDDTYYYNGNYWFLRMTDGFAINYDVSPLSGLVANRQILINHYRERLKLIEQQGFGYYMGFEPMTHNRVKWENKYAFEVFMPKYPNIDLCHGGNLTKKRWTQDRFIKKPKFWNESNLYNIPGWVNLPKILDPFYPLVDGKKKVNVVTDKKADLTIVIPARNEEFIGRTVSDILEHSKANTEVIVALDGYDVPIPQIPYDKRVIMLGYQTSIGQRAITNQAVRLSKAKYVAKCDAHCSFDDGFDLKLLNKMKDDYTMVPVLRNLHAFDWVCEDGHRRYQSPSGPCKVCGKETHKEMKWIGKTNPQSVCYRFDKTLHFQYFNGVKKLDWYKKQLEAEGLTDTMSLQGSFFLLTRDRYWELNICDEKHGSWGQQGTEVACKTWLSGGRVVCNHDTWYAHLFRTQGGDFGFPYENPQSEIDKSREYSRSLFLDKKFDKAKYDLNWLINKFAPVPDWN